MTAFMKSFIGDPADALSMTTFKEFIAGAKMTYDYTHQRIVVYNPDRRYAYVYSLESRKWSIMHSHLTDHINSYPEALALEGQQVVDLSDEVSQSVPFAIVTRPLKLGGADVLKTVTSVIQRGVLNDKKHTKQILLGSRDLRHWHVVSSSVDIYLRGYRGTPYKYFRIVAIGQLDPDETLIGATLDLEPRMANKTR